jgi:hypothetical protein
MIALSGITLSSFHYLIKVMSTWASLSDEKLIKSILYLIIMIILKHSGPGRSRNSQCWRPTKPKTNFGESVEKAERKAEASRTTLD